MHLLMTVAILCLQAKGPDPEALLRDPDPDRRVQGARLLARQNSVGAAGRLLLLHGESHPRVRRIGLKALGEITDPEARVWLIEEGLSHRSGSARRMAALALGRMEERGAAEPLRRLLRDRSASVRTAALESLGRLGAGEVANEVSRLLRRDESWEVRAEAAGTIGRLLGSEALPDLQAALGDRDARVRLAALEGAERISPDAACHWAVRGLGDPEWIIRCTAAEVLARSGGKEAVGPLIESLEDAEGRSIRDILNALGRLTGRRLGRDPGAWKVWWEANGPSWEGPRGGGEQDRGRSSVERVTYYDIPIWSERVVFVIDLSQSMREPAAGGGGGSRADRAREELGRALESLPGSSRFNLIRFRSEAQILAPRPLRPCRANQAASLRWIDSPGGGTNLYDALEVAIRAGGGDTVFLLTDGAPSAGAFQNKTEILESIREMNRFRKVRIHAIGIGNRAVSRRWQGLLEGLAEATDGEFVTK